MADQLSSQRFASSDESGHGTAPLGGELAGRAEHFETGRGQRPIGRFSNYEDSGHSLNLRPVGH